MSQSGVENVIRKAVVEPHFRALLLNSPAEALMGFDLCEHEVARLSEIDSSVFELANSELEDRLSRTTGGWSCQGCAGGLN